MKEENEGTYDKRRNRYTVYLYENIMISLKKDCLDKGKRLSNVLEGLILKYLKEK